MNIDADSIVYPTKIQEHFIEIEYLLYYTIILILYYYTYIILLYLYYIIILIIILLYLLLFLNTILASFNISCEVLG